MTFNYLLLKPHIRLPIFLCGLVCVCVSGCVPDFDGIFILDNLHFHKNLN